MLPTKKNSAKISSVVDVPVHCPYFLFNPQIILELVWPQVCISHVYIYSIKFSQLYSISFNFTQIYSYRCKSSTGKRQFNGIVDVYVKTVKSDGVRGLYRGFAVSCVCIFIYRGLYFGLYDTLKPLVLGENAKWIQTFLLGWGVTITAGLVMFY